jgi:hypothetical protein
MMMCLPVCSQAAAVEDDDIDPLDAFMANEIKPALEPGGPGRGAGVKQEAAGDELGARAMDRANSRKEAVRPPPRRRARPLNSDSSSGADSEEEQESDDEVSAALCWSKVLMFCCWTLVVGVFARLLVFLVGVSWNLFLCEIVSGKSTELWCRY